MLRKTTMKLFTREILEEGLRAILSATTNLGGGYGYRSPENYLLDNLQLYNRYPEDFFYVWWLSRGGRVQEVRFVQVSAVNAPDHKQCGSRNGRGTYYIERYFLTSSGIDSYVRHSTRWPLDSTNPSHIFPSQNFRRKDPPHSIPKMT